MIDHLKIGPVNYQVQEVNDLHDTTEDGKKRWLHGHIRYADSVIDIGADQSGDRKVITIWHEAIHGILDNAGHDGHPEALVIALGFGLVQLIRDNPALVQLTVGESTLAKSVNGNQHPTLAAERP